MRPYRWSEFDGEEDAADEREAWFVDADREGRAELRRLLAERRASVPDGVATALEVGL